MKTYHVYRVTYTDDGAQPPLICYFIGNWVGQALTDVMNDTQSGVKREVLGIERVLANVWNPDAESTPV